MIWLRLSPRQVDVRRKNDGPKMRPTGLACYWWSKAEYVIGMSIAEPAIFLLWEGTGCYRYTRYNL